MSQREADSQRGFSVSDGAEEGVVTDHSSSEPLQQPVARIVRRQERMKFYLLPLSALFFLSGLFSLFSPLPILILFFRYSRLWGWLGALLSGCLVALLGGDFSLALYVVFIVPVALVMAELLKKKMSLERVATITLLLMGVFGLVMSLGYGRIHHVNILSTVSHELNQAVDQVVQSIQESGKQPWVDAGEAEEWKRSILIEMPSAIAILALVMVWANLMIFLRLNFSQIRESLGLDATFYRRWKAPEFLVWPTLVCGVFLLVEVKFVSVAALNLFKFLMAIYAIHGLSVLSFFFEAWGIRRAFRGAGFVIATFLVRPLLLVLGFFDLWFDFRSKVRQS